jgi:hypothetical protein
MTKEAILRRVPALACFILLRRYLKETGWVASVAADFPFTPEAPSLVHVSCFAISRVPADRESGRFRIRGRSVHAVVVKTCSLSIQLREG